MLSENMSGSSYVIEQLSYTTYTRNESTGLAEALDEDSKIRNGIFNSVSKRAWKNAIQEVQRELDRESPPSKNKFVSDEEKIEDFRIRSSICRANGAPVVLSKIIDKEIQKSVTNAERNKEEAIESARAGHETWLRDKNRLRVKLPPMGVYKEPSLAKFDTHKSGTKSFRVINKQNLVGTSSADMTMRMGIGLKTGFAHALDNGVDMEKSREALLRVGYVHPQNFTDYYDGGDVDEDAVQKAEEEKEKNPVIRAKSDGVRERKERDAQVFKEWTLSKDALHTAKECLRLLPVVLDGPVDSTALATPRPDGTASMYASTVSDRHPIPTPGAIAETGGPHPGPHPVLDAGSLPDSIGSSTYFRNPANPLLVRPPSEDEQILWKAVGYACKAIDRALLTDWIAWSKPLFTREECIHTWDTFLPEGVTKKTLPKLVESIRSKEDGKDRKERQSRYLRTLNLTGSAESGGDVSATSDDDEDINPKRKPKVLLSTSKHEIRPHVTPPVSLPVEIWTVKTRNAAVHLLETLMEEYKEIEALRQQARSEIPPEMPVFRRHQVAEALPAFLHGHEEVIKSISKKEGIPDGVGIPSIAGTGVGAELVLTWFVGLDDLENSPVVPDGEDDSARFFSTTQQGTRGSSSTPRASRSSSASQPRGSSTPGSQFASVASENPEASTTAPPEVNTNATAKHSKELIQLVKKQAGFTKGPRQPPYAIVLETLGTAGSSNMSSNAWKRVFVDPPDPIELLTSAPGTQYIPISGALQQVENIPPSSIAYQDLHVDPKKFRGGVRITGLLPNTTYIFRVRAYNRSGSSSYAMATFTTAPAPPPPPILTLPSFAVSELLEARSSAITSLRNSDLLTAFPIQPTSVTICWDKAVDMRAGLLRLLRVYFQVAMDSFTNPRRHSNENGTAQENERGSQKGQENIPPDHSGERQAHQSQGGAKNGLRNSADDQMSLPSGAERSILRSEPGQSQEDSDGYFDPQNPSTLFSTAKVPVFALLHAIQREMGLKIWLSACIASIAHWIPRKDGTSNYSPSSSVASAPKYQSSGSKTMNFSISEQESVRSRRPSQSARPAPSSPVASLIPCSVYEAIESRLGSSLTWLSLLSMFSGSGCAADPLGVLFLPKGGMSGLTNTGTLDLTPEMMYGTVTPKKDQLGNCIATLQVPFDPPPLAQTTHGGSATTMLTLAPNATRTFDFQSYSSSSGNLDATTSQELTLRRSHRPNSAHIGPGLSNTLQRSLSRSHSLRAQQSLTGKSLRRPSSAGANVNSTARTLSSTALTLHNSQRTTMRRSSFAQQELPRAPTLPRTLSFVISPAEVPPHHGVVATIHSAQKHVSVPQTPQETFSLFKCISDGSLGQEWEEIFFGAQTVRRVEQLSTGTAYAFKVQSTNIDGCTSLFSPLTIVSTALHPPRNLRTIGTVRATGLTLGWEAVHVENPFLTARSTSKGDGLTETFAAVQSYIRNGSVIKQNTEVLDLDAILHSLANKNSSKKLGKSKTAKRSMMKYPPGFETGRVRQGDGGYGVDLYRIWRRYDEGGQGTIAVSCLRGFLTDLGVYMETSHLLTRAAWNAGLSPDRSAQLGFSITREKQENIFGLIEPGALPATGEGLCLAGVNEWRYYAALSALDPNSTGYITYANFCNWFHSLDAALSKRRSRKSSKQDMHSSYSRTAGTMGDTQEDALNDDAVSTLEDELQAPLVYIVEARRRIDSNEVAASLSPTNVVPELSPMSGESTPPPHGNNGSADLNASTPRPSTAPSPVTSTLHAPLGTTYTVNAASTIGMQSTGVLPATPILPASETYWSPWAVVYMGTQVQYDLSHLLPNNTYQFRVSVVGRHSFSLPSKILEVYLPPLAPFSPVITDVTPRTVSIRWYPGELCCEKFLVQAKIVEGLLPPSNGQGLNVTIHGTDTLVSHNDGQIYTGRNSKQENRRKMATNRAIASGTALVHAQQTQHTVTGDQAETGEDEPIWPLLWAEDPEGTSWVTVYTGSLTTTTITGLSSNTVYRLRVLAVHKSGALSRPSMETQVVTKDPILYAPITLKNSKNVFVIQCPPLVLQSPYGLSSSTSPTTKQLQHSFPHDATQSVLVVSTPSCVLGDTIIFTEDVFVDGSRSTTKHPKETTSASAGSVFLCSRTVAAVVVGDSASFMALPASARIKDAGMGRTPVPAQNHMPFMVRPTYSTKFGVSNGVQSLRRTNSATQLRIRTSSIDSGQSSKPLFTPTNAFEALSFRELSLQVLWSSVSNRFIDTPYHIKPGSLIKREGRKLVDLDISRACWVDETGRWSLGEELAASFDH